MECEEQAALWCRARYRYRRSGASTARAVPPHVCARVQRAVERLWRKKVVGVAPLPERLVRQAVVMLVMRLR